MSRYRVHTDFQHVGTRAYNGDLITLSHSTGEATLVMNDNEKADLVSNPMLIVELKENATLLCKV